MGNDGVPLPYLGESAALLTALCWSLNSVCFTVAGRRVGSAAVNLGRLLMAWAAMLLVHLVVYGTLFPMQAGGARLAWLGMSGLIGFALGDAVLFGARLSMLLMTLSPIFSALLAWLFLGQSLSPPKLLAMVITLGGIGWVVWGSGDHENHPHLWRGILLGIGGALGQSVGLVFSKFGLAGDFPPISLWCSTSPPRAACAAPWAACGMAGPRPSSAWAPSPVPSWAWCSPSLPFRRPPWAWRPP